MAAATSTSHIPSSMANSPFDSALAKPTHRLAMWKEPGSESSKRRRSCRDGRPRPSKPSGSLLLLRPMRLWSCKVGRSEEHTSELQSLRHLLFPLFFFLKKKNNFVTGFMCCLGCVVVFLFCLLLC